MNANTTVVLPNKVQKIFPTTATPKQIRKWIRKQGFSIKNSTTDSEGRLLIVESAAAETEQSAADIVNEAIEAEIAETDKAIGAEILANVPPADLITFHPSEVIQIGYEIASENDKGMTDMDEAIRIYVEQGNDRFGLPRTAPTAEELKKFKKVWKLTFPRNRAI